MSKPDITLEPSKGVISEMSARIYSAHIIRGDVRDGDEAQWMERSIREAIRIAKTVDASTETEDMPIGVESPSTPRPEAPAPRTPAKPSTRASSQGDSAEESGLSAVIEEVLSAEDAPEYKTRDR